MEYLKKKLESGAEIDVQPASFQDANKLLKTVMREAEKIQINLGVSGASSLASLLKDEAKDDILNTIKNAIARVISSEEIESALWPCMSRVTYNGQKVTKETFDNPDARQDFLPLMKEVLGYNLRPFFKGLNLSFMQTLQKNLGSQK